MSYKCDVCGHAGSNCTCGRKKTCPVAKNNTNGTFYCTREAGHDGPCAAVPIDERMDALVELRVMISEMRYYANMSDAMELHTTAKEQRRKVAIFELAADALARCIAEDSILG